MVESKAMGSVYLLVLQGIIEHFPMIYYIYFKYKNNTRSLNVNDSMQADAKQVLCLQY